MVLDYNLKFIWLHHSAKLDIVHLPNHLISRELLDQGLLITLVFLNLLSHDFCQPLLKSCFVKVILPRALLDHQFELVDHVVLLVHLLVQFAHFFLEILENLVLLLLLVFNMLVGVALALLALLADQDMVIVDVSEFALVLLQVLFKHVIFIGEQPDFGLVLFKQELLLLYIIFHLLVLVDVLSILLLELLFVQNRTLGPFFSDLECFFEVSELLPRLYKILGFLLKQIL